MAESYSLEAILSARDTNFTSTMDNAQKAMGGLGKSAGGIGASIGKIAAGFGVFKVVSGTISALSNGFSSLTSELNESSIAWQTFESNMTMLGKSSGEIDSTRKSLEKFAQQTIYSASDMAQTYGQMAAIGVEDTERLVKAMGGLAASAENPQQAMKTLSQQMTQAMAKPTLSWADFKLMLEQTPAGMSEVAKEMGYALDDFVVAVQDGEIASKDFAKAVSEVGTNEHFGAMATEFKSVGQAMDGARETIANKLMPAFELLSAIGIKAISGLTDWIDTLDFSGLLAPIESLASMFGIATDEISAMTDTIKMSSDEIQSVADNWESMTLTEKQATVQTMGQEDLAELLEMLGVDFDSIPDEYTKDAFLNAHGKDSLEELLWVTGKWHDLTLEEKRAVLEAQIENKPLEEAIENMGLWEDASFVSKFAEINMNDNDSGQQVLDLINYYRELDGQEPIELEVDVKTKPAEKAVDGFVSTFKKFGKSVGKITKGIGKVVEKTGKYFEPAFDFLGDLSKSSLKMLGKYVDATGQLFEGDWAGAWGTFKSATVEGLTDVVSSLKTNVPKMWDAMKVTAGNVGEWFNNINWGNVWETVNGLFDDMGAVIATIDWVAVAGEVGGVVGDFVGATKVWLEENVPKAIDWVQDVLLNPNSKLNKDAGAFKAEVERMVMSFIDGLGIKESIMEWVVKVNAKPFFDWGSWQDEIDTIIGFFNNENYDQSVMLDISIQRSQGRGEDEIKQYIDEQYGEGTYQKHVDLQVNTQVEYEENRLNQQVGQLDSIVDAKLAELSGEGKQVIVTSGLIMQILKDAGVDEEQIDAYVESLSGGTYNIDTTIEPTAEIEEGESIGDKISSFFDGFGPVKVSAQVEATPDVSVADGSGKSGGLTGAVGSGLSGTFSALQAEVTAQMTAISTAVSASMTTVSTDMQTGMTNAQTAVQSAMVSIVSTITAGMLSMVVAGRLGTTMFNIAFRAGLAQAVVTAQSITNQILSVFNNLSSNLYSSGVMAGAGFRNGLGSQASSIVSKAQEIADSVSNTIQSALRIASPSKVTTYLGEMVGAGLIAGMDGMVSGVESSANRLSLATLPTTDLGSSRYSGSISGQSTSSKLDEVIDAINRGQVIMMDSGALVGETSRQMDVALGQQGSLGGRHKL